MPERILVGTDGSSTAERAVDRAVEVAKASGASLTVVCAGPETQARAVVDATLARLQDTGVAVDGLTGDGEPSSVLVDIAESGGYDLLVTGNRGMTGITRFLRLGSVPNRVTHHLPCNMLIVKTT
jgi:nucleotide-binding universal stress UspA family protein